MQRVALATAANALVVGVIGAKKTHIVILHKLIEIKQRLTRLERKDAG